MFSKSPSKISTRFNNSLSALSVSSSQICGCIYFPQGTLNKPFLFTRYNPLKQVRFRKEELCRILYRVKVLLIVALAYCHKHLTFRFHILQSVILSLNILQCRNQLFHIVTYSSITCNQIAVDIVDYCTFDIWMLLQHIKQHSTTANEWFYVCRIVPIIKVSWKFLLQLFNELSFSTNPFDEWFCF